MHFRYLGRSGLKISEISYGNWITHGSQVAEEAAVACVRAALDAGSATFDTADVYAATRAETVLGNALAGERRQGLEIFTKVYWPTGPGQNDRGLSRKHILESIDGSLRRLRTDYVDLYQMHHIDRDTPWDEIWQAMEVLVAQGKILYVGSSNFAGWHIVQANDTAAARGFYGLVSEQSIYNLLTREIELEVLPAAVEYGVGVIPWSPLEGGLLGGVLTKEREGRRRLAGRAADTLQRHREQITAYEALCDELGEQPAHVALAWLLHQEGVTGPIIGPRTEDQLDDAQHAITVHLGEDVLKRLDDIFPGYQPAPEHYAW